MLNGFLRTELLLEKSDLTHISIASVIWGVNTYTIEALTWAIVCSNYRTDITLLKK